MNRDVYESLSRVVSTAAPFSPLLSREAGCSRQSASSTGCRAAPGSPAVSRPRPAELGVQALRESCEQRAER